MKQTPNQSPAESANQPLDPQAVAKDGIHAHNQRLGVLQRPDPATNRTAYERWYYKQSPAIQQSEWDKYYAHTESPGTAHATDSHAVSQHYAHDHVTPLEASQIPEPMKSTRALPPSMSGKKDRTTNPFRSLIVAAVIALIFSFAFYNEIVIGQVRSYLSPASTISTPIILDPSLDIAVGPEARIIIPKINVDVPVVYDLGSLDEGDIQTALNDGVVDYEYPGTVQPGQVGNNVIVGHSSNNFLNSGKYKFAFVLLERLDEGDTFILHYESTRYVYKITNKQVIEPSDFDLINQPTDKPITTLITCTPPGTSWKRLVIQGEQISPVASTAQNVKTPATPEPAAETIVPGNAPSLWQRITDSF